ncbi:MAG: 4-deoxy-4-formamido-L-arabinose-phosphoundecaprenol deformylase, partial [Enterobacteriaceae bacterium]
PQIAVGLPTFDEVAGTQTTIEGFNDFLLQRLMQSADTPQRVYTIHAEVEGIVMAQQFEQLLQRTREQGIEFVPLGQLLPDDPTTIASAELVRGEIPGREGWLGCRA